MINDLWNNAIIHEKNLPFFSENSHRIVGKDDFRSFELKYIDLRSAPSQKVLKDFIKKFKDPHLECFHFGSILIEETDEFNAWNMLPVCTTCECAPRYEWQHGLLELVLDGGELNYPNNDSGEVVIKYIDKLVKEFGTPWYLPTY